MSHWLGVYSLRLKPTKLISKTSNVVSRFISSQLPIKQVRTFSPSERTCKHPLISSFFSNLRLTSHNALIVFVSIIVRVGQTILGSIGANMFEMLAYNAAYSARVQHIIENGCRRMQKTAW